MIASKFIILEWNRWLKGMWQWKKSSLYYWCDDFNLSKFWNIFMNKCLWILVNIFLSLRYNFILVIINCFGKYEYFIIIKHLFTIILSINKFIQKILIHDNLKSIVLKCNPYTYKLVMAQTIKAPKYTT